MARPPDKSGAEQFKTTDYIQSWAANNPYYASHVNWAFDTFDTRRTQAAVKSGVVHTAGYTNIRPEDMGYAKNDPYNWASPVRKGTPYDKYGNVQKQRGDVQLGLVLMGGYQFPGQAFSPARGKSGLFTANTLAKWMNKQRSGGYSPSGLRYLRIPRWRDTGWAGTLSQSVGSNKAPGGYGQSSEYSTIERYNIQGTSAGWKPLSTHSINPHFDSALGQMFQSKNTDTGFARRVKL